MILKILLDEDHYGYEIVKLLRVASGGELELKEATLYSSLRRLENDGDIRWHWGDETQGGRRKYYAITDQGRQTYHQNVINWEHTKRVFDLLIGGPGHADARPDGATTDDASNPASSPTTDTNPTTDTAEPAI